MKSPVSIDGQFVSIHDLFKFSNPVLVVEGSEIVTKELKLKGRFELICATSTCAIGVWLPAKVKREKGKSIVKPIKILIYGETRKAFDTKQRLRNIKATPKPNPSTPNRKIYRAKNSRRISFLRPDPIVTVMKSIPPARCVAQP